MALAADLEMRARMTELRIYFSRWPPSGMQAVRPPVLRSDPGLQAPDVAGDYDQAPAAGDVDAGVASFEPGGYVREPAGGAYTHRGTEELRAFYELLFADGGGMPLELCAMADDGGGCALEVQRGRSGSDELVARSRHRRPCPRRLRQTRGGPPLQ